MQYNLRRIFDNCFLILQSQDIPDVEIDNCKLYKNTFEISKD